MPSSLPAGGRASPRQTYPGLSWTHPWEDLRRAEDHPGSERGRALRGLDGLARPHVEDLHALGDGHCAGGAGRGHSGHCAWLGHDDSGLPRGSSRGHHLGQSLESWLGLQAGLRGACVGPPGHTPVHHHLRALGATCHGRGAHPIHRLHARSSVVEGVEGEAGTTLEGGASTTVPFQNPGRDPRALQDLWRRSSDTHASRSHNLAC